MEEGGRLPCRRESRTTKSHSAASAKTIYTTFITTSLDSRTTDTLGQTPTHELVRAINAALNVAKPSLSITQLQKSDETLP